MTTPQSLTKPDLTALLGSRICHDLISPLGAIGNGVELLAMAQASDSPELSLISESVENANARIRFFRVAFGAADTDQQIARREVCSILAAYCKAGRISIDWQVTADPIRATAKLAFLLIQCLESAMPFGGQIVVTEESGRWQLEGRTEKLKIEPELWEVLSNPSAAQQVRPAEVQFALVPQTIHDLNRNLQVSVEDGGMRISF